MDPLLNANDIVEPSGENDKLIISASFKLIFITAFEILFITFLSNNLFKLILEKTGPAVKLLAIPTCHISTFLT